MQTISDTQISDFTAKLIPLTYFRRRAGEVLEKLPEAGNFILTKDGNPIAKLSVLAENKVKTEDQITADIRKIRRIAGGLHLGKIAPSQINRIIEKSYEKMLPR